MMQTIADETNVHGIKDAYYANWLGRVFFGLVFIFCSVMMVLQLKGLFEGYIDQAVGTRTTDPADLELVDVPSFYYCHDYPFANIQAFREMLDTTRHNYMHKKYYDCVHSQVFDKNPNPTVCAPYLKYWKETTILLELLTSIILPPEDGRPDVNALRKVRPYFDKNVGYSLRYYASLKQDVYTEMAKLHSSSLEQVLKNQMTVDPSASDSTLDEILSNEIHGVLVNDIEIFDKKERGTAVAEYEAGGYVDEYYDYYYRPDLEDAVDTDIKSFAKDLSYHEDNAQRLSDLMKNDADMHSVFAAVANARGRAYPTLSLDGVCWEMKPESQLLEKKEAIGRIEQHVVTHLGGFGPQLREIVYPRYDKIPYGQNLIPNDNNEEGFKQTIVDAIKFMEMNRELYASQVSIAAQGGPQLGFDQKIRVDASTPHVLIKYWTNKRVVKNRRSFPCKLAPWTTLDQAHCNQAEMRKDRNVSCEQYLAASNSFPERNTTDDMCTYNHKGLLWDVAVSDSMLKTFFEDYYDYEGPTQAEIWRSYPDGKRGAKMIKKLLDGFVDLDVLKKDGPPRWHLVSNLTESSPECPRPCTQASYHFEVSYPAPIESNTRKCAAALAYLFVPTVTDKGLHNDGTPLRVLNNATYEAFSYAYNTLWTSQNPNWQELPCSIVEFERAEVHGQIHEEYFLYGLSDLASNVGGTLGLWIGASVISIVQFFYLFCLEKMFQKVNSNSDDPDAEVPGENRGPSNKEKIWPPHVRSRC